MSFAKAPSVGVIVALCAMSGCAVPVGEDGGDSEPSFEGEFADPDPSDPGVAVTQQGLSWVTCSPEQQLFMSFILPYAQGLAEFGYNYQAPDPNRFWAQYWFGYPSKAGPVLKKIRDLMNSGGYTIVCDQGHGSCKNHVARAQGDKKVRLCGSYWNLVWEDAAYVFLHEIAHHSGAPKDHAYGEDACYNLARNDPAKAVQNGDNYEQYYRYLDQ
jgi:Lysine-specific metallo-endopeptidase